MDTLSGWLSLIGLFLLFSGVVWLIINLVRKTNKKKSLLTIAVGAVSFALAVIIMLVFPTADYSATTSSEGKEFVSTLNEGTNVTDKTLRFKVTEVGKSSTGVGLAAPGGFTVIVSNTDDSKKITKGDTVTVDINEADKFATLWLVQGSLE